MAEGGVMGIERLLIPQYVGRRAPRTLKFLHRLVAGGIAAAVAMLLVTAAVLEGFWGSYIGAARRFHGDIVVLQDSTARAPDMLLSALRADSGTAEIRAESPFTLREGLLTGGRGVSGVIIKAIDWESFASVHPELRVDWKEAGEKKFASAGGPLPVILGRALAGDKMPTHLFMPTAAHKEGESLPVQVVGVFDSGLYDYDHQFIFVPRRTALVDGVELRLADPRKTWSATQVWQGRFPEITITHWGELNHNMFEALRLQRSTFMLLMSLFVIIALSNLVGVVGLQVYFRRRDVAILRLLGLSLGRARWLIWMVTSWTTVVGVAMGAALGGILIFICTRTSLVRLPETVYFVDRLPLDLPPIWALAIIAGSLGVAALVVAMAVRRMADHAILKGLV